MYISSIINGKYTMITKVNDRAKTKGFFDISIYKIYNIYLYVQIIFIKYK